MARGGGRGGGGAGGRKRKTPASARGQSAFGLRAWAIPAADVPHEAGCLYSFPLRRDMARWKPDRVWNYLTSPPHNGMKCLTRPRMVFVPMSYLTGRTLLEISTEDRSGEFLRASVYLFLAQSVRGGGRLFVSHRRHEGVSLGYYFALFERRQPPPSESEGREMAEELRHQLESDHEEEEEKDGDDEEKKEEAASDDDEDGEGGRNKKRKADGKAKKPKAPPLPFSHMVPLVHWMLARTNKVGGIRFAKELEHAYTPASGGKGARATATALSDEQARAWEALHALATPENLCEMVKLWRNDKDEDYEYGGTSDRECIEQYLDEAYDPTVAMGACVRQWLPTDHTREAYDDALKQEDEAMSGGGLTGIPADGVDSYFIPHSYAAPLVLRQYAMPHMTRPIDTESKAFMSVWRDRQRFNPALYGTTKPTEAFASWFLDNIGTTSFQMDKSDLEGVLKDIATELTQKRALTADDPGQFAEDCRHAAKRLEAVMITSIDLPVGLSDTVKYVLERRQRGDGITTLGEVAANAYLPGGTLHDGEAPGGNSPLSTWYAWLFTEVDSAMGMVHLHVLAAASHMIMTAVGNSNSTNEGTLQSQIVMEGPAAAGKTYVPRVLSSMSRSYTEMTHQSSLADTGQESRRGPIKVFDEARLDKLNAEHATSVSGIFDFIAGRAMVGARSNNMGTQQATTHTMAVAHMHLDDKGQRRTITTNATRLEGRFYMSNAAVSAAGQMTRRRMFMFTVMIHPSAGPDVISRLADSTDLTPLIALASSKYKRTLMSHTSLTQLVNVLVCAGIITVSTGAARSTWDIAAGDAPRFRAMGPFSKFAYILAYSTAVQDAVDAYMLWIGAPDPLKPLDPLQDLLALRPLTYSTEHSTLLAMDVVLGRTTSQVYVPGMLVVAERVRNRFRLNPEDPTSPFVLVPAPSGSVAHEYEYAYIENFFEGVKNYTDKQIIHLTRFIAQGPGGSHRMLESTVHVCLSHLLVGPPCEEDEHEDSLHLPTLVFAHGSLYARRSFLLEPVSNERRALQARAFQPGTPALVSRYTLDVDPNRPGVMAHEIMTREKYARLLYEGDAVRRQREMQAQAVHVLEAVDVAWGMVERWARRVHAVPAHRAVFTAQFTGAYVYVGSGQQRQPVPADPVQWVRDWANACPTSPNQTVSGQVWRQELDALRNQLTMHTGLAAQVRHLASLRQSHEACEGIVPDDIEEDWRRGKRRNPRHGNMDYIRTQVELQCMDSRALDAFSAEPRVPYPTNLFIESGEAHLIASGVPACEVPYHYAHPINRAMLSELALRRNREVAALVMALDRYRAGDDQSRLKTLLAVISLGLTTAAFFHHLRQTGGLAFRLTRGHIALFMSKSYWDIEGFMMRHAGEYRDDARGVTWDTMLSAFIDIVTGIVLRVVYERRNDVTPARAAEEGGNATPMPHMEGDSEVEMGIGDDMASVIRQYLPNIACGQEPHVDREHDLLILAVSRPDLFRDQCPAYEDGTPVAPTNSEHCAILFNLAVRRIRAQREARKYFAYTLLAALVSVLHLEFDADAQRNACFQWVLSQDDNVMMRRAYADHNRFEMARQGRHRLASALYATTTAPLHRLPITPVYYPPEEHLDAVKMVIGFTRPLPASAFEAPVNWAEIAALNEGHKWRVEMDVDGNQADGDAEEGGGEEEEEENMAAADAADDARSANGSAGAVPRQQPEVVLATNGTDADGGNAAIQEGEGEDHAALADVPIEDGASAGAISNLNRRIEML